MKKEFSNIEIEKIIKLYTIDGLNANQIGVLLGVSKTPILRVLKNNKVLRVGKSNGVKIILTTEQENLIKEMYLQEYKTCDEIAKKTGLTRSFIDKYLSKCDYRRTKSEAIKLVKTGVKLSQKTKDNMTIAQRKVAVSGKRKQTGGVCKNYVIRGLSCQGTYEKFYIEKLINDGLILPKNGKPIITPFGVYYPDFEFNDKLIEIKSDYTYDVLIGLKVSRFTKKIETKQYEKIKWVNKNLKQIDLLVIDKRNNKIIKKEI